MKQSGASVDGDARGGSGGESKAAIMRKALHDKGWAEKQAAGFTKWLNFTLVDADQLRHGNGAGSDDEGDEEFLGEPGGVSSSPLKAMVAMVRREDARVLLLMAVLLSVMVLLISVSVLFLVLLLLLLFFFLLGGRWGGGCG